MNKPVRVLHVFNSLDCGGAENLILSVLREIDHNKVQFDFLIQTEENGFLEDEILRFGSKIYRICKYKIYNHFKFVAELNNFFNQHTEHSIVHCHVYNIAAVVLKIAAKYNKKSFCHAHSSASTSSLPIKFAKFLFRKSLSNMSNVKKLACSKKSAIFTYGKKNFYNGHINIINNGINVEKFLFDIEKRNIIRNKLNIKNDTFVIMHTGSFNYEKNHDFIIDLILRLENKTDFVFLFFGKGKLECHIKKRVEDNNLNDNIKFMGVVTNINYYLCCADLFLFPSRFEGLPIALVEAQASGINCLITDSLTEEIDITDLINRHSLLNIDNWLNAINSYKNNYSLKEEKRKQYNKIVSASDFNIKKVASLLQNIYLGKQND